MLSLSGLQHEMNTQYLDEIQWTSDGLVPAIAQDALTGRLLMMAWMSKESLRLTISEKRAVYWSRSRQKLWRKGETSGNSQIVKSVKLDCDGDVVLLAIRQEGGIACHTGRQSCFYRELVDGEWITQDKVLKDPQDIYS